jgi:hypothetical protein
MFGYHPNDPYQCPRLHACPHLFGASLERVVSAANWHSEESLRLFHEVERLREEISQRDRRIEQLEADLARVRDALKQLQRGRFQKDREESEADDAPPQKPDDAAQPAKKRGAPVGHPGWFRPIPTEFDGIETVTPKRCPQCGAAVELRPNEPPHDHVQEDILDGRKQVICFRHVAAWCPACAESVEVAGPGELPGCPIGPHAKAMATFLHFEIGLSCRKVRRVCEGLLDFSFSPAAVLGFDARAAAAAEPLADDIASKLQFSIVVYADETSWSIDGESAHVWFHGNEDLAHYHIDSSRAGAVSRAILGDDFDGVLTTDCYAAYERHAAGAKQKCLAHLRRTAKDWRALVPGESSSSFFTAVIAWVARACALARQRPESGVWSTKHKREITWLRAEQLRLETMPVDHELATQLQNRLKKHHDEWLVFLDHAGVSPTNNLAERALRPLVILRKLTYGNRSSAGAKRVSVLSTVIETSKRQGHRVLSFLVRLFTASRAKLVKELYAPP